MDKGLAVGCHVVARSGLHLCRPPANGVHEPRTYYGAIRLQRLFCQYHPRDAGGASICHSGDISSPQRSGRIGSVVCHGRDSLGHFRGCRLRFLWCIQVGGHCRLPCGQRGHHEHPDYRVDSRGHCRPYRAGRLFLEYFGEVPRHPERPGRVLCRRI